MTLQDRFTIENRTKNTINLNLTIMSFHRRGGPMSQLDSSGHSQPEKFFFKTENFTLTGK